MDTKIKHIRHANKVTNLETGEIKLWPSISQAKHWSRLQPKGAVRRFESLERAGQGIRFPVMS